MLRDSDGGAGGGGGRYLDTFGTWDRGLGVLNTVTDPTGEATSVGYDGFGRVTFVRAPPVDGCEASAVPVQRFRYELAVGGLPISVVTAFAENDCDAIGAGAIETRTYVDGLGRTRAVLSPASSGDPGAWIQSGLTILNQRGSVKRAYQQEYVTESEPSPQRAVRIPGSPYEWAGYDAFDRPRCATSACGQMTCTTYHALSSDVCDHLDMSSDPVHAGTCTTTRNDGHGRAVDQVLRNRDGPYATLEYYRLWTDYRADNAVTGITRAETTTDGLRGVAPVVSGHQTARTFTYDTVARRIGSTDPDSDSQSGTCTAATCTWRYLYSEVGDLVAVRDPRGCGQNFYYDKAGRLIGEDYVECAEALPSGDLPVDQVPASAVALVANIGAPRDVDVRYYYEDDAAPTWATAYPEVAANITNARYEGRLLAVSDRGQRSAMAYDARGQVSWAMRQMAMLENGPALTITNNNPGPGLPPVTAEGVVVPVPRAYDVAHTYQRTAAYDHGGRPTSMVLPTDPDWTGGGAAPVIGGVVAYDARGLPNVVTLTMDAASRPIVSDIRYTEHGLVREVVYGDTTGPDGSARDATTSTTRYDACLRPRAFHTERDATSGTGRDLGLVTTPMHQQLVWDEANNLVRVEDLRLAEEWPDSFRPQSVDIWHDALYRVVDAEYTYHQDAHTTGADIARDWRTDFATSSAADPMRPTPAAMAAALPAERVNTLRWRYDWLGNMQEWTDDASSFYERSLGDIENGADRATHERPGALHLASNIQKSASTIDVGADRGGWVEASYGENGNVVTMTVHAQCFDQPATSCWDDATLEGSARTAQLRAACACAEEQHYQYRWDELNRLHQARRFDRVSGVWGHAVTQRYRYDSANQRTIKSAEAIGGPLPERIALYIYPGDFERRGLERNATTATYNASAVLQTETQYLVGGARVVWKHNTEGTALDREQRVTVALTDIIQTSSAVMDLESGELLEASTYYHQRSARIVPAPGDHRRSRRAHGLHRQRGRRRSRRHVLRRAVSDPETGEVGVTGSAASACCGRGRGDELVPLRRRQSPAGARPDGVGR